ncbi:MAG: type VI-D CRISPR-associated RNA-guided ribonuclease Cas13d, partial [Clostridia bacterium]|nr:type VI-D CRISPR-associated RNA-guided ribonuclease Cas13d [Clostridia bacterium]
HFAKILLFVCSFLNGKEINELLCAFINKFDGIADLLYSAKKCGYNITFGADYKEIEKARNIANDIRIIKNVARMKRDPEKFSGQMMLDVVKLLGIKSNVLEESDVYESSLTPAESKKIIERINKNKDNKQLRNFLKNNVVKSKWFFYIIRYMKPENCAKLMRNHKMVAFVLNGIDDKQIIRYYQSVQGIKLDENCVEDGRKTLAKRLAEFNIDSVMDTIENMPKREYENNAQPSVIKEKNKALVTLYLTVAYLIVKNIVKINTNFNIAFSCLERDYVLMFCPQNDRNIDLLAVTKRFLDRDERLIAQYNKLRDSIRDNASWSKERKREEYKALKDIEKEMHFSLHHYYCVKKNYATALALVRRTKSNEINLLRTYRNNVAHLNVVNAFPRLLDDIGKITSYYDVYVYSMQRLLIDEQLYYAGMYNDELSAFVQKYKGLLDKHNTYVKDLSWIINVSFAYNVARYKNLCIKELFYGELSKEKIGTEEPQEKKEISCSQIVEEEEIIIEIDEEVELAYGYFSEQIVTMADVEATARGGLRGVISGTQYKITVPPAIVQESGNAPESYVGKEIEVRITDWSKGGNSFSSELV